MTQSIELPWGENLLKLNLPKNWRVLGELKPEKSLDAVNPLEACSNAMAGPIGTQRLSSRNLADTKILIVVDDHSRPTRVADFLPAVLSELRTGGAKHDNIEFLIATGVHRADTPDEVAKKLGLQILSAYSWSCHDAYDPAALEDIGTTSRGTRVFINRKLLNADLIICVGAIEPHLLL
jgi:lactate racemase